MIAVFISQHYAGPYPGFRLGGRGHSSEGPRERPRGQGPQGTPYQKPKSLRIWPTIFLVEAYLPVYFVFIFYSIFSAQGGASAPVPPSPLDTSLTQCLDTYQSTVCKYHLIYPHFQFHAFRYTYYYQLYNTSGLTCGAGTADSCISCSSFTRSPGSL